MDTKASTMDILSHQPSPTSPDKVRLTALQLATNYSVPGAVATLVRLHVFEALSRADPNASLTAAEIATLALPGKPISISYFARLLRMVSGKQILREIVTTTKSSDDQQRHPASPGVVTKRRYALEPVARFFVDDPEHESLAHNLFTQQQIAGTWEHLHEAVVDDEVTAFARGHGGLSVWEYGKQNADFGEVFNKAMSAHSKIYLKAVLDEYKGLEGVKVLVDVGGGLGSAMKQVTERHAHIRAVNFDQPHVISACKSIPTRFARLDDDSCVKILTKCYEALPPDGKVIGLDNVLPEIINFEGADHMALQFDVHMMVFTESGARERTEGDFRKLSLAAGFRQVKVVCKLDLIAVTEFQK